MHCADICLSATHNESARKLVMTQFEPCQYRHKSRYASVLQNRCFYTYIWLAYLVRFFERLLRQTTPKLLPLFECLPLLFLLMSLRYSERPNNIGDIVLRYGANISNGNGVFSCSNSGQNDNNIQTLEISRPKQNLSFDLSQGNPIYGASTTNQPASIRFLCLIRAYEV